MPTSTSEPPAETIKQQITAFAHEVGFDTVGVTAPSAIDRAGKQLDTFIELGRHGDMDWLADKADRRRHPNALWPEARSIIMLGLNYGPAEDPMHMLERRDIGNVSVYARGRDYHDVVKKRLKRVGRWLGDTYDCQLKVFVDTAPVMEKPLAQAAGLGWQGKHTNLVSRSHGSWLFLGAIFTTLDLPLDEPEADHCGSCSRCLEVCPTDAFPTPYQLDARRCISYLTIEHKGHIPREFRAAIGNRIYGCDDCLAVCPWNKYAATAREQALHPRPSLTAPLLEDLARLDDTGFRALFAGSPVKRTGRDRFVRNVLIALGNCGRQEAARTALPLLDDPSPLVRAMAVWALSRLMPPRQFAGLKAERQSGEADPAVRGEWTATIPS